MKTLIRNTRPSDYDEIKDLCLTVYPESAPWTRAQIESHLKVFPQGQFVAENIKTGQILAMAASLVICWDDYSFDENWRDFTDTGMFTNHDPEAGRTLYGAEIMVHPDSQGYGIGSQIYAAREELARELKLLRIRAGARLRGYGEWSDRMKPADYVKQVIRGEIFDPTLSFQLRKGFRVIDVVSGYLRADPESQGYAAVIEWLNSEVAKPEHYQMGNPEFRE